MGVALFENGDNSRGACLDTASVGLTTAGIEFETTCITCPIIAGRFSICDLML